MAQFDEAVEVKPVSPAIRQQMIEQCANLLHKQQRYCVWQLLDYALRKRCGKGVDAFDFSVDDNGKWNTDCGVSFSLSHSGNVVAVALSDTPVGIDVEAVDVKRFNARLAQRILTENERAIYNNVTRVEQPHLLAEFWTKKESLFKRDGGKAFAPSAIDTTTNSVSSTNITFNDKIIVVSIATLQK